MKKKVIALLSVLTVACSLTACSLGDLGLGINSGNSNTASDTDTNTDTATDTDTGTDSDTDTGSNGGNDQQDKYIYNAFTTKEQKLFTEYFGFVIPFVANDEYEVNDLTADNAQNYDACVEFYVVGNTKAEYNAFKAAFTEESGYTFEEKYTDDYGDTCYVYSKNGAYIDMSYYEIENDYAIAVYVYIEKEGSSGSGGNSGTDFTADEKALFNEYFGFVIPFIESEKYYVEEYSDYYEDTNKTETGLFFYTEGNTEQEAFTAYLALFSEENGYTFDEEWEDEYGDTWYGFSKNGYYLDICYYEYEGENVIDIYIYGLYEGDLTGDGGNQGGSGDGGTDSGTTENVDLITNAGKGLPQGQNGVYNVDFTKATYVKNVTDQGYYLGGCPTVGSPKVLVIPVEFSDCTAQSKGYSVDKIKAAFEQGGKTDYFSVYDYYYTSSYGKLSLDITVLDNWFKPAQSSTYYKSQTDDSQEEIGDQMIMDEALAYLDKEGWNLSQYDSDKNGAIDAVVMINTLNIDSSGEALFNWAYRYWNGYADDEGYYYEYDGVCANDYLWAPYQFLYETYDEEGYVSYDNTSGTNTYTFIHEFGHILGADDYYDYTGKNEPMAGCDMMDGLSGDHNAFTKFNYGWLTTSRLVVAEDSVTLTLEDFSKNGDTIIIANNWDETLGAYQEYYVLVYYKNTGLNDEANGGGYFSRDGVVVYHVNASLYKEVQNGETYYDVYNSNTDASDEYGTEDNLIEYVKSASGNFTFVEGDTLPTDVKDDNDNALKYTFTVGALTENSVSITFTKK